MSTEIFLRCLGHNPPLYSDAVGTHLADLPRIRQDIANRANRERLLDTLKVPDAEAGRYFRNNTVQFLIEHPKCRIGIQDEYGNDHPITEGDE